MRHAVCCLFLVGMSFWSTQPTQEKDPPDKILQQAKKFIAQVEGKLNIKGLKEPVEVLRDRWGVPHIYAKNGHDLFFAQGFVAAQDRLFQMDWWRRVTVGETAEVLGQEGLAADHFARLIKFRGDTKAEWQSYSPDTREIALAFTDGINACIDHLGDKLPIEFQILGHKPKRWHHEDVVGRMAGIIMTGNFEREIFRAQLIAAVGLEKARLLAPTEPEVPFAPVPGLDLDGINQFVLGGYQAAARAPAFQASLTESNNWVVAGKRSASGKPLLANDPHRAIAVPSLRYLVHLHAPGWNVIGSGEPGLPGVAVGHNERIAWGFTIVGTDQADIVVEELNSKNHNYYKVGKQYKALQVVREKFNYKGQEKPVELELKYSRHGPILHVDEERHRAFALRWVGSEPGTAGYLGSLAVGRAKNWKEFLQAMNSWKVPSLNIVYGDVDGNIGWVAAGLTPVRNGYDGLLPVPGTGAFEWERFLKVEELPQEFNPARGYIATANNNILPPGYKHHIAYDWAPDYRVAVIRQRLKAKKMLTLEDCRSIQHEVTSLTGKALAELIKQIPIKDAKLKEYAKLLEQWDGVLSVESAPGTLYSAWLRELQQEFIRQHLPKKMHHYAKFLSVRVMLQALEKPDAKWFGADAQAKRDEFLQTAFERAVAVVRNKLGDDPKQWAWGKLHTVTFRHPLGALSPAHAKAFNLGPLPRPGDGNTPNNTRYDQTFQQLHGASYRQLFDLADWDRGLATSTPGQSGQPGSPHYADLLPLWQKGEYFPLGYSRKKVEELTERRLSLVPLAN
jgi:penicillin amidase